MSSLDIRLTEHSVTRYQERVRPGLAFEVCRRDLERLVAMGRLLGELPWRMAYQPPDPPDAYLELSDGVVLGLKRYGGYYNAITCLIRGGMAPGARKMRSKDRKKKRKNEALGRAQNKKDWRESHRKKVKLQREWAE